MKFHNCHHARTSEFEMVVANFDGLKEFFRNKPTLDKEKRFEQDEEEILEAELVRSGNMGSDLA